tara:strand:- start:261 stop:863 length:603 start_codon:yes stop_codon:yes gene_type:complete
MSDRSPLKLGVLLSGRGSNMKAILENCLSGKLNARIELVISNKEDAGGLAIAKKHNIPAIHISPQSFETKDDYELKIVSELQSYQPDLIILAGYMKIVGSPLLEAFPNQILNIHPSLLPKFKGLNAQKQALASGESESGCTVHWVDESLDGGPIISQESVPILDNDTEESLSQRILEKEHLLYSKVIESYYQKRIERKKR